MATGNRIRLGLTRGLARRCPNCGVGRLFAGYLKVAQVCEHCSHRNGAYRADDAPPYFTILIVGHLVVGPLLAFGFIITWPVATVLSVTLPALVILTLILLPLVKGAVIGFHWAADVGSPKAPTSP
jgi:uncharacterized protein (DUF983 family)